MLRSVVSVAVILSTLFSLSTHASASCLACPNCLLEPLPNNQGNACLNYWTCANGVVTCYYPSVSNPGTLSGCAFSLDTTSGTMILTARSGSDTCASTGIGDNSKCLPPNNPWNLATGACTAAEQYVGEPNSAPL